MGREAVTVSPLLSAARRHLKRALKLLKENLEDSSLFRFSEGYLSLNL